MAYLEMKNFNKKSGKTEVLKGINLDIEKGQVVTILGSSGSGKTTLLRCINFLEIPDNGLMSLDNNILFDSDNTKKDSYTILRKKRLNFGLVFQSFNLFPQYTVFKNITLAPSLLLKEKFKELKNAEKSKEVLDEYLKAEKEKIKATAEELLAKTGLSEKKNAYPCELSGGQCQRVAIARALALKPCILCFDEPTSALDPELTNEVLNVIRSLKDDNHTMIIVTHEMEFARKVSDKVVFMSDGVICEQGSPEEIFDNTKSEKLKAFLNNVKDRE